MAKIIESAFFNRDASLVAQELLGKVLRHKYQGQWLSAQIIETEAYYTCEKASHSSLGPSPSRLALFGPPGTIYMYYARGGDSLNFTCKGTGDAVIVKSAFPFFDRKSPHSRCLPIMQKLNPLNRRPRLQEYLCKGQTLLCKSLGLKVPDWNNRSLKKNALELEDTGHRVREIVQCRRLGIPKGRDEHLMLRFLDQAFVKNCTENPLTKRGWKLEKDYRLLQKPKSMSIKN